jgi:hypothetical protein
VHPHRLPLTRWLSAAALGVVLAMNASGSLGAAEDLVPQTPAAFFPGGMLGIQLGGSWRASKHNPSLHQMDCKAVKDAGDFDEVCFFRTSNESRVGGAEIHDGFIAGKGDHVVLVGTGISITSADDPLAEAVVRSFEAQINSAFQHTGDTAVAARGQEQRIGGPLRVSCPGERFRSAHGRLNRAAQSHESTLGYRRRRCDRGNDERARRRRIICHFTRADCRRRALGECEHHQHRGLVSGATHQ